MKKIEEIISKAAENDTLDVKRFLFGSMDFTTLKCTDSEQSVMAFVERVNAWDNEHPDLPHPAAVCVYPCFAEIQNRKEYPRRLRRRPLRRHRPNRISQSQSSN